MSTNTETAQQIQHTPGAIRAADAIFKRYDLGECEYTAAGAAGVAQDHRKLVELIDRETCAPELLAALKRAERCLDLTRIHFMQAPVSASLPKTAASIGDDLFAVRAAIAKAEART